MTRGKTAIFILSVLSSLLVLPVVNILSAAPGEVRWREQAFLFNADVLTAYVSRGMMELGISTRPEQVVIGRDGWLFLGERYDRVLSNLRRSAGEADLAHGRLLGERYAAWEDHFTRLGVKQFRIVMVPNKSSVYPDRVPNWLGAHTASVTDAVLRGAGESRVLDLRETFARARQEEGEALLFHRTDTHWNFRGAAVGFRAMASDLGRRLPELRWPEDASYEISRVGPDRGGDLANFLHLRTLLQDEMQVVRAMDPAPRTERFEYLNGELIPVVNASPGKSNVPLVVRSNGALNPVRVLWIQDSFGGWMAPFMALTFSETMQLHWVNATAPEFELAELVKTWKPDIILLVVVERSMVLQRFAQIPPPPELSGLAE